MRVIVYLRIVGEKETVLEGDAPIFDKRDYSQKAHGTQLDKIGFWLMSWRYNGYSGPSHKKGVFIPWSSTLYVVDPD